MKNPQIRSPYAIARIGSSMALSTGGPPLLSILGGQTPVTGIGKPQDDGLTTALQFLKFDDKEIARMTEMVSTIASLASVVGWSLQALSTTKDVLTLLGILKKPEDPSLVLLKQINEKVQQIYKYLEHTDQQEHYAQAINWRSHIGDMRNAVKNLAQSRSQTNVDAVVAIKSILHNDIEQMLDPHTGTIAFLHASYGAATGRLPMDWVVAATPFFMQRSDGAPIDYQAADKDLSTEIWDPGYYLDVLFEAIGMRIASGAVLEPAFRSTGYDRDHLRDMYKGILAFIDTWNRSFFLSRIIGPLDPAGDAGSGAHRVADNPYYWPYHKDSRIACLPMIVVDAVSGITSFNPIYDPGLMGLRIPAPFSAAGGYFITYNYDAAVATATRDQALIFADLRARCGINRMYELAHSVWNLIVGPVGSEFVNLSEASFSATALRATAPTQDLSLGVVGAFAGRPGKTYPCRRYFQDITKKFSTPLARRADASRIQLGYKLVVSVGGGVAGTAEIVLCDYSAPNPNDQLPLFPTAPLSKTLSAPAATVYDVVQSAVLSVNDEDAFERTGTVPLHQVDTLYVDADYQRQRLFIEPRSAPVKLQINVTFDFDDADPDHPFVGNAHFEIKSLEPEDHPYGFIANVEVYETVVAALDNGTRDARQSELADTMTLHFAPSFIVASRDYFADRAAGFEAMDAAFGSVNERYVKVKAAIGPIDPIERVSRQAQVENVAVRFAGEELRAAPALTQPMIDRLQERVPQR